MKYQIKTQPLKKWKRFIIPLMFILLYFGTHEYLHVTIFRIYECEEIKVGMMGLTPYTTATLSTCAAPSDVMFLQTLNEVIGYSVVPLLVFIVMLLYYILDRIKKIEVIEDETPSGKTS